MGKPTGFLEFQRELPTDRPEEERTKHNKGTLMTTDKLISESARDCYARIETRVCQLSSTSPLLSPLLSDGE